MVRSKQKSILMLLENATYPSDERVRHEAIALVSSDYRVVVISPKNQSQPWHEVIDNVIVYRFPCPKESKGLWGYVMEYGYSMIAIFLLSLYVLFKEGFDIIHTAQPPDTFVFVVTFYKLFGKRYVFDHHDLAPELYNTHFRGVGSKAVLRLLLWLESLSFRLADHVITTNESYKKIAIQRGRVDEKLVTIVRNGPDLEEYYDCPLKHDLHKEGKVVIGYVGVMGIQDGVDNLVRAINHLVHDLGRTDILCVIVGTGSAMPGLKSLTDQLHLAPYILFTGWVWGQDEVAGYLEAMDICVAPEPSDPYNDRSTAAKIMEYMAMGKPIVSFDLPEHRYSAKDAALYAMPGDELDFARKLAVLIDDPKLRNKMGENGQIRIEKELAWSYQAKNLLKAYASIK